VRGEKLSDRRRLRLEWAASRPPWPIPNRWPIAGHFSRWRARRGRTRAVPPFNLPAGGVGVHRTLVVQVPTADPADPTFVVRVGPRATGLGNLVTQRAVRLRLAGGSDRAAPRRRCRRPCTSGRGDLRCAGAVGERALSCRLAQMEFAVGGARSPHAEARAFHGRGTCCSDGRYVCRIPRLSVGGKR